MFGCLSQEHTVAIRLFTHESEDGGQAGTVRVEFGRSRGGGLPVLVSLNGCHGLCLYTVLIDNGDRNWEPAMQILAVQVTFKVDAAHDES